MKRKWKWKWLILLCIPALLFAVLVWNISGRQIPVDVIGELPEKDVAEITAAVKREMRREIFPNFSWQSLKDAPKAVRAYFGIKLISISVDGDKNAFVYLFRETNGLPASRPDRLENGVHVFPIGAVWTGSMISMEKRTNGWFVIDSASF
jgi:hypothetical protein